MLRALSLLCLMLVALLPLPTQAYSIQKSSLANGLGIFVIEDKSTPAALHMLIIRAGAADEPAGKSGIAHFLEHMMFKGTPTHPQGEFSRLVSSYGGYDNAFTSQDVTAFYQVVPREHLEKAIALEADRFQNIRFDEALFKTEKKVIIEERKLQVDSSPTARLVEQMRAMVFSGHPYQTPVIGWMQEIEALTLSDLRSYYETHYTAANSIAVFAGNISLTEATALAETYYGKLPAKSSSQKLTAHEITWEGSRMLRMRDATVTRPELVRIYRIEQSDKNLPSIYATLVMNQILASGDSSRLYHFLVEKRRMATHVSGSYNYGTRDDAVLTLRAIPVEGVPLAALRQAVDDQLTLLLAEGVYDDELDRAKRVLISDYYYGQDGLQHSGKMIGHLLGVGLPSEFITQWPEKIQAVTKEDVLKAAKAALQEPRSVTGYLEPEQVAEQSPQQSSAEGGGSRALQ